MAIFTTVKMSKFGGVIAASPNRMQVYVREMLLCR